MDQLGLSGLQFLVDLENFPQVRKDTDAAHLFASLPDNSGGKVYRHLLTLFIDKGHPGGVNLSGGPYSSLRIRRIISAANSTG